MCLIQMVHFIIKMVLRLQKIQQQLSAGSNGANLHKEARTKTHGSNY